MAWAAQQAGVTDPLHAVWGFTSAEMWAVGDGGAIYRRTDEEEAWTQVVSPTAETLRALWGAAADDVWALGDNGTIIHWDGASWTAQASGVSEALRAIFGFATNDVWVVGDAGTILHWDGSSWSDESFATAENLLGIWGAGDDDIWAVGTNAKMLHYNGTAWSNHAHATGQTGHFNAVSGSAANSVWVAGNGGLLMQWDGVAWTAIYGPSGATNQPLISVCDFTSIHVSGGNFWVVADGVPYFFFYDQGANVLRVVTEDNGYAGTWEGGACVFSFGSDDAWAVGPNDDGQAYRFGGGGSEGIEPEVTQVSGLPVAPTDLMVVDVTDNTGREGLRRVLVLAFFSGTGAYEVVHDGDAFAPFYAGSLREDVTNGYRFTVGRRGGWLAGAGALRFVAIDAAGNEA